MEKKYAEECIEYDHIPEEYDVVFYHCKVCGTELSFLSETQLEQTRLSAFQEGLEEALMIVKDTEVPANAQMRLTLKRNLIKAITSRIEESKKGA